MISRFRSKWRLVPLSMVNATILGLWTGQGGEGAKHWLTVLTEIKNRGVADVCIVCCDDLKGPPDSIATTWPRAITQTWVLHLIRQAFRLAGRHDWDPITRALRPVLHSANRSRRPRTHHRVHQSVGPEVSGDHPVVGQRMGRVRAVPCVRGRGPPSHLFDERHRVVERQVPPRCQ